MIRILFHLDRPRPADLPSVPRLGEEVVIAEHDPDAGRYVVVRVETHLVLHEVQPVHVYLHPLEVVALPDSAGISNLDTARDLLGHLPKKGP